MVINENTVSCQELNSLIEGLLVELVYQDVLTAEDVCQHHTLLVAFLGLHWFSVLFNFEVGQDQVCKALLKHEDRTKAQGVMCQSEDLAVVFLLLQNDSGRFLTLVLKFETKAFDVLFD